jgi:uncharacterized membrane protein
MELIERLLLGGTMVAGGASVLWVGLRQRRGTLARNHLAGLRTREPLANDHAWKAAHDATAVPIMAAGGVGIATGLGVLVVDDVETALVLLGIGTVVVLALVVGTGVWGHRIARSTNRDPGHEPPRP